VVNGGCDARPQAWQKGKEEEWLYTILSFELGEGEDLEGSLCSGDGEDRPFLRGSGELQASKSDAKGGKRGGVSGTLPSGSGLLGKWGESGGGPVLTLRGWPAKTSGTFSTNLHCES